MEEDEKVRLHTDSMDRNLSKLWEIVEDRGAWHAIVHGSQRVGDDLVTEKTICIYEELMLLNCESILKKINLNIH